MRTLISTLLIICVAEISFAQSTQTPTNASERMDGINKRRLLEQNSLLKNVAFRNVGPTIMSGRAVNVAVNPDDATEFYVAYASGGLWHTNNNGQSFNPIFDKEDVLTIGDVAVDWKNNSIWIGSGEANSSRSSYAGNGVYQSSDSGKTWNYKGLPESQHIGRVLLHPANKNIVYVAALGHLYSPNKERGVYKTTDGGATWKQILFVDENTGAVDVVMDPTNSEILYACMWHRERRAWNFTESGASSGIYKSTDGGNTWTLLTNAASGFPQGDGVGRIGIAICPQLQTGDSRDTKSASGGLGRLYAIMDNQFHRKDDEKKDTSVIVAKDLKDISKESFLALDEKKFEKFLRSHDFPEKYSAATVKDLIRKDSLKTSAVIDYLNDANNSLFDSPVIGAEVYRSDDAGKSWKKVNITDLKNLCYTYGYYFGKIFVSPTDENKIVVCGLPLLMSKDGGKNFSSIDGENTHGDHHAVWMNPKKDSHMIICNDGGLNITYDNGKHWFKANTPPVGQFYSVCTDNAKPYNVYGGLQDNGVWGGPSTADPTSSRWTQDGNYPFKFLYGGDGMQVQVDTRDNNTVYSGYQFGYYVRIDKTSGDAKDIHPKNNLGEPNYRFNWQTPIHLSKHNQDILYMGTNKFNRSMNKGDDMKAISDDLTAADKKGDVPYNTIVSISESPLKFGLIYVGSDDGNISVSKDDGYTWKKISSSLPQSLYVSRVVASMHHEGTVYASLNGYRFDNFKPYLFKSDNYGETWNAIGGDLPSEPINVVKEDTKSENILYVGTDNGLYATLNGGKTFMTMNDALPRVAVHDITLQTRENEIVLGTHGRSIFIAKLDEVQQLNDTTIQKPLSVFTIAETTFNKNWGKKFDPFAEEPYRPSIHIPFYAKENGVTTVRIKSEKNILLRTLTDTSEAGINYVKYDLMMDSTAVSSFEKSFVTGKKSFAPTMKQGDDKKYYLPAGTYTIEVSDALSHTSSTIFVVKKAKEE